MKNLLLIPILCASMLLAGCDNDSATNAAITTIIATGTGLAFQYVPMGDNKKLIAKYVSGISKGAYALTGNETKEEATQLLLAYIPKDVQDQFPAIGTTVVPQVIGYYLDAKSKFGAGTQKFVARMNAVAAGLQQGVANFI